MSAPEKITKTGETCAQVQADGQASPRPIDQTTINRGALRTTRRPRSLSQYRNFLYWQTTRRARRARRVMRSAKVDDGEFNLHMKPGAECVANSGATNCTTASFRQNPRTRRVHQELRRHLATRGGLVRFQAGTTAALRRRSKLTQADELRRAVYDDHDLAASWVPRFFLYGRSLGVMGNEWYTWDLVDP